MVSYTRSGYWSQPTFRTRLTLCSIWGFAWINLHILTPSRKHVSRVSNTYVYKTFQSIVNDSSECQQRGWCHTLSLPSRREMFPLPLRREVPAQGGKRRCYFSPLVPISLLASLSPLCFLLMHSGGYSAEVGVCDLGVRQTWVPSPCVIVGTSAHLWAWLPHLEMRSNNTYLKDFF